MDQINNSSITLQTCKDVNSVNISLQCAFVQRIEDCQSDIGYLNYLAYMYCSFGEAGSTPGVGICALWLLILFVGLGVTANQFLCPSLFVISKTLHLSQNVAGVTLLAFGNGAPDIFSALAGIRQGKTELVVGGLIGAGIFVTTVVAGSIFLCQSFRMMKRPFIRDVAFYMMAASWVFYLFYSGSIRVYSAIGLICLYFLYIVVVIVSQLVYQRQHKDVAKPLEKSAEANGETQLSIKGAKLEDDPEAAGIVLKSFYFYNEGFENDERPEDTAPPTDIFIASLPEPVTQGSTEKVPEATSNGVASSRRRVSRQSVGDVSKTLEKSERPCSSDRKKSKLASADKMVVNQWRQLLKKVSPVDIDKLRQTSWPRLALAFAKSPVVLLLTMTTPVVDPRAEMNNWCRPLNCLHLLSGPLFILVASGNGAAMIGGILPVAVLVAGLASAMAVGLYLKTLPQKAPTAHWVFAYIGFGISVMWIYLISIEIVVLLQAIGVVFNLSDTIIGLTILAWGNCLLDFMANLNVARKGFPRMGVAACFGSPFLTLLIGVGVSCLIKLLTNLTLAEIPLRYSPLITVLFSTLAISLVSTFLTMLGFSFAVKRPYGVYLIAVYVTFLVTAILVEVGVI